MVDEPIMAVATFSKTCRRVLSSVWEAKNGMVHCSSQKNQWAPRISFDYEEIWSQQERERSKLQFKQQGRKLWWKWNAELSGDHHYLSSCPCLSVRLTHFSHWLAPLAAHHHHAALNDLAYGEGNESIPADYTWYTHDGQSGPLKCSHFPINTWTKETSPII